MDIYDAYRLVGYVMFGFSLGVLSNSGRRFQSKFIDSLFDMFFSVCAGMLWPLVFFGAICVLISERKKNGSIPAL